VAEQNTGVTGINSNYFPSCWSWKIAE